MSSGSNIHNTGIWPEDFTNTAIITLAKKQNASNCSDLHNKFTDTCIKSDDKSPTAEDRIKSLTGKVIGKDQFGFVKGSGTREAIGSLRILAERCMEHGKQLHVCFVDYEKVFDHVNCSILITAIK